MCQGEDSKLEITPDDKKKALLVEYQKAQDSAEHHERLGWQSKSILWAASIILLGYSSTPSISKWVVAIFAFAGIVLLWFPIVWNRKLADIKKLKYKRCGQIEAIFNMQQHTKTQKCFPQGQLKKLAKGLVCLLALAWIARLIVAWFPTIRGWIC